MYSFCLSSDTHCVSVYLPVLVCVCVCVCVSVCSSSGLVMLLQDPDPVVRVKAAEAMGHFH